ncbi:hypothetical protein CRUP_008181 [Coryphaenoides rupestris]|nr:hypothetical protein CRUP_008181 [Coryphaenoides rupestris]
MIETIDTQHALQAVERLQARLRERAEEKPTEEKLSLLRSVLQSPLFHQILALQKSMPSSPRFSLRRPTTLKPRPPDTGFSSSTDGRTCAMDWRIWSYVSGGQGLPVACGGAGGGGGAAAPGTSA